MNLISISRQILPAVRDLTSYDCDSFIRLCEKTHKIELNKVCVLEFVDQDGLHIRDTFGVAP